ncbi:bifunctional diaminohydroxyphosphoribosylaminopyrimidine deaminase/5-amino-6-(5-phosphoribosylamino)uracil reductase RibD [Sulfurimonas sp.]|uniref:bifunctional diaminohydroxyphosphoribosylaminopyrimidine deaminase/5-amino-6-(5-phosphoribosylamino)uracil reductase RibD n=1 Tax=Sulfurimonas sp. TaxID=2022749 RepID=UPI002AB24CCA|nr:bifunctional diaminohydroxyphosphoribosylaminopyrimidine deaminase/5-amino-6-(5-phosphoribosylamino)uracil reductase RibD [Sulfurimonas sp.]
MVIDSNFFMSLALKEAWKYQGLTYPNPAVGCTIVGKNNELLAIQAHQKSGFPHAEVMALRDAYINLTNDDKISNITSSKEIHTYLLSNHKNCFKNISLYTTLEPCSHIGKTPSCASLISSLGIKKVYVGFNDINKEASGGNDILQKNGVEVVTSIMQKECEELIQPFNKWQKENFVFFKWAQRLDASMDGGQISCEKSRINVHAMRNVCDLLVIGGNTVRMDRPRLDARLVNGKAPDILIISREKEFDKTIPLFDVGKRKVTIADNFSLLKQYKNIMIEGSSNMLELCKEEVDYHLCYISPTMSSNSSFNSNEYKFKILNLCQVEKDIIMWMKRES